MMKKAISFSLLSCTVLLGLSMLAGYLFFSSADVAISARDSVQSTGYWSAVAHILQTNLPTALSLFSGAIFLGGTSLFIIPLVGIFLGASVRVSVGAYGWGEVIARTVLYTPFEILGFILAGSAGLVPLVVLLRVFLRRKLDKQQDSLGKLYMHSLTVSLKLFGVSLIVLLLAAVVEGFAVIRL